MENTGTTHGKWAGRFIAAAVIQGAAFVVATILVLDPLQYFTGKGDYFSPAKVIAGGGGGTWFFTGFVSWLVVGVLATAVTAIFYYYIEDFRGKVYRGFNNLLAWGHLLFMNIGVAGAFIIMSYQGYLAGVAQAGALAGTTPAQVHEHILGWTVDPIGGFILLACIGALLGGLGYVLSSRTK